MEDAYPETKREGELQQGQKEAEYLIETLTHPGDLIVDPFIGPGTFHGSSKEDGKAIDPEAEISKGEARYWQYHEYPKRREYEKAA